MYGHLDSRAEDELGPVGRGLVAGLVQEVPRLQGLARFKTLGGSDLQPDPGRLVLLACVYQPPGLVERVPRLTGVTGALSHPVIEGGVTVDELAESAGWAGSVRRAGHGSTIAGRNHMPFHVRDGWGNACFGQLVRRDSLICGAQRMSCGKSAAQSEASVR